MKGFNHSHCQTDSRMPGEPTGGVSSPCVPPPPPPPQCGGRRRYWGSPPRQQTHIQRGAHELRHAPCGGYNAGCGFRSAHFCERRRGEHHAEPGRTEPEDRAELCHEKQFPLMLLLRSNFVSFLSRIFIMGKF